MSFLTRLFADARPVRTRASHSRPASQLSPDSAPLTQQNASRREMLRLVLRDTLNRTGIPTAWLGADLLAATSRGREPGIHVRLLLKHWDPRLMLHGVAFQEAFRKRLLTLDPQAGHWMLGFSWQFSLASDSPCPPLPHPGTWTSGTSDADAAMEDAGPTDTIAPSPADLLGGSIVISGPAATPESSAARPAAAAARPTSPPDGTATPQARAEAKADLERLFAVRDDDLKRARSQRAQALTFASTEPAPLAALQPETRRAAVNAADAKRDFAKTDIFRRPERPIDPVADPTKH